MLKFPDHVGEAELEHNDHLSSYQTVTGEIENDRFGTYDDANWVSLEEKQNAIETNELWTFWWYEKDKRLSRHASSLDALMSSFGVEWKEVRFPSHKASLSLSHNLHLLDHKTVAEDIDFVLKMGEEDDWIDDEEKKKAIASNEMWTLQWYPDTPVGCHVLHASSVEALLKYTEEM